MHDAFLKMARGALALGALVSGLAGAQTLLGPTPYLSQADSPFAAAITGGSVVLETFEDGLLNVPNVTASAGAEVRLMDLLALRVGYDGRIDADNGLTAGFGVKVADMGVDYAYIPFGRLGNSHRVALTYQFGPRY